MAGLDNNPIAQKYDEIVRDQERKNRLLEISILLKSANDNPRERNNFLAKAEAQLTSLFDLGAGVTIEVHWIKSNNSPTFIFSDSNGNQVLFRRPKMFVATVNAYNLLLRTQKASGEHIVADARFLLAQLIEGAEQYPEAYYVSICEVVSGDNLMDKRADAKTDEDVKYLVLNTNKRIAVILRVAKAAGVLILDNKTGNYLGNPEVLIDPKSCFKLTDAQYREQDGAMECNAMNRGIMVTTSNYVPSDFKSTNKASHRYSIEAAYVRQLFWIGYELALNKYEDERSRSLRNNDPDYSDPIFKRMPRLKVMLTQLYKTKSLAVAIELLDNLDQLPMSRRDTIIEGLAFQRTLSNSGSGNDMSLPALPAREGAHASASTPRTKAFAEDIASLGKLSSVEAKEQRKQLLGKSSGQVLASTGQDQPSLSSTSPNHSLSKSGTLS